MKRKNLYVLILLSLVAFLSACDPEVGTEEWCIMMQEKPKGDWTANEASDFAQHCLFKYQK